MARTEKTATEEVKSLERSAEERSTEVKPVDQRSANEEKSVQSPEEHLAQSAEVKLADVLVVHFP